MANILSDIRTRLTPQITRLNDIIAHVLRSDTAMMNTIVEQYLRTKGKQLRPLLTILSGRLFGGIDSEAVLYGAAAIELLHNASLIHDDVIDQACERRGQASINSVWSNHVAVLVGDFFVTGALRCAVRTDQPRILQSLAQMGADLSLGEINQYDNAKNHIISEQAYLNTISKKTASLFVSCVTVGAYAAGADDTMLAPLKQFAHLLGLCFQIKDDTFDYIAETGVVGKPTGNDLREGKITLPLIYALGRSDLPQQPQMAALVSNEHLSEPDIARLLDYAKQAGGIEYAQNTMQRLRNQAVTLLADNYPDTNERNDFCRIFDFVISRDN